MADAADEIVKIAREIAARKSASATLPPNPEMVGRKDRLEELVKAILEEDRPIVVPRGLGIGKRRSRSLRPMTNE